MFEVHDFTPITDYEKFAGALRYIEAQTLRVARYVLGDAVLLQQHAVVDTLTIFAQSPEEYRIVHGEIAGGKYGEISSFSHGPTTYVSSNLHVGESTIKFLGVRDFNPEQKRVGYGDFPVDDFAHIRYITASNMLVKPKTSGLGKPLLEVWHPDKDVLAYIVPRPGHNDGAERGPLQRL